MPRLASLPLTIILIAISGVACAPTRLALPSGSGTPGADYAAAFGDATGRCREVRTLQAELALSGRIGRQRLRGRVLAGLVPDALRLEAVSPFGSPAFILVADGSRGTLLLSRDRRVLQDAPPAEILDALIGMSIGADDLRALLSGCVKASAEPIGARAYGPDWIAVDLAGGSMIFLQRQTAGWRIVAGRHLGLEIEYARFNRVAGLGRELPTQVRIESTGPGGAARVSLTVGQSQIEVNSELPRDGLVAVKIPPGLTPISLEELRDAGPLGARN